MRKYCIVEKNFIENHAGSKARNDIADILVKDGWEPLVVHHSEEKELWIKLKCFFLPETIGVKFIIRFRKIQNC